MKNNMMSIKITKTHIIVVVLVALLFCVMLSTKTCSNERFEVNNGKLIMFYADWCGHCKKAKPAFISLVSQMPDRAEMVDCTSKEVASQYGIRGFPTYRYYTNNDTYEDYKGGRDLDAMVAYINNH